MENLSKIKGEKANFIKLLNELKNAEFIVKKKQQMGIYELKSVKSNRKEIIDEYKRIIMKSFFVLSHSSEVDDIYNQVKQTLENYNYIENYISLLNNRRNILLTNIEKIILKTENNAIYSKKEKKELKEIIRLYKEKQKKEDDILNNYYQDEKAENKYLPLFSGLHIHEIYQLIKAGQYDEIKRNYSYYFNNIIKNYKPNNNNFNANDDNINNLNANDDNFEAKLNTISRYFKSIIRDFDAIFTKNKIKQEYENKSQNNKRVIYIKSFNYNEYEEDCLNLFYTLTGNLPCFSNIIVIDEEILEIEYLPFLYKVIKLQMNCLFIMVLKECQNRIEEKVLIKINELFNVDKNSLFILLYSSNIKEKLDKYLTNVVYEICAFEINDKVKENIKNIFNKKVLVVYSDVSGVGKTTYINKLKSFNNKIIYFPVNGYINKKSLMKQVKTMDINSNLKNIIYIDLYDTLNEDLIKEFLFQFIFFKFYRESKDVLILEDTSIQIIIELPNTYKNYFNKYKILNFFPKIKIINDNDCIPILQFPQDFGIQDFSCLLKLYKKGLIGNKNLDFYERKDLSENEYKSLIREIPLNNQKYNLYQKINLIKLLSTEFKKFSRCYNLQPSVFLDSNIPSYFILLRENIIKSIINNTKYIIELDDKIEKKLFEENKSRINELERKEKYELILSEFQISKQSENNEIEKLNPSLIGMHENERLFSFFSSNKNCAISINIRQYIGEINNRLISNYPKNPIELEKDNNINSYIDELLNLIIDENLKGDGEYKHIKESIESQDYFKNYVFTKDNFVKIALLFLRIRAGIPTILMGETGSGKTYMIRLFSLIYGQNTHIYKLNFHSGTTDKDVIDFIQRTINEVDEEEEEIINKLYQSFKEDTIENKNAFRRKEQKYYNNLWFFQKWFYKFKYQNEYKKYDTNIKEDINKKIKNRKIIIFFDEINTSHSLPTIKRLLCDESFRKNYNIPDRFIIICACNPYRLLSKENQNLQFGLHMRNMEQRKLVYTVNPLPYSLLYFVLYFNDLSEDTRLKYIIKINEKIKCSDTNKKIINKLVSESHNFISKKGGISSVSLRDINKFGKLFKFFNEVYFTKYKTNENLKPYEKEIKSIALSIHICYYLRLPSSTLKESYIQYINNAIKNDINIPFEEIFEKESLFLTNIVLEGKIGFAKNKGLCENIFSEFICILLREPLIICGKPGSSKSLSIRLLLDKMVIKKDQNEFFKNVPIVVPSYYQCSLASTSENLELTFKNAKEKIKKTENEEVSSLIIMDELGIADESQNNPLKVLHSELDKNAEMQDEKKKFAFIGISNWTLDASKMGRTINRVVEEPNKDYLENTAKEIIKSININFLEERYENVIKSSCNAYYSYLIIQAQNNKQDFHGFRDFYYLIKYIFYSLNLSEICFNKNNYNLYLEEVIKKGIYRNFSGFENSENLFLEQFNQNYQPNQANHNDKKGYNYNLYSRIKDNIESKFESRYILLINDNKSINEQILKYILEDKDYEIISSENLKAYDNEKNGILNLIIKIEVLMNKEIILILKDLNILYPSLYELFNKNFNEYGNKFKYVRISYENQYSLRPVNEKFRIIILVNKDELDIQEKPFLNRFEKQIFSLETLLSIEEKHL